MGGGGDDGGTTQVKTDSSIPEEFKPFFTRLFAQAQAAGKQVSGDPFSGPFTAAVNPQQIEALNRQEAFARGVPQNIGQNVFNLGNQIASGAFLDPSSNPFLQSTINLALAPAQQAQEQAIQSLRSRGAAQGAAGGNRAFAAENALIGQGQRNFSNIAGGIAGENLRFERLQQQLAPQFIQQGLALQQLPQQLLGGVGDLRQQLAQQAINERIQAFNEANAAPFRPLFPIASILSGVDVGRSGTSTTTQSGGGGGANVGGGISGALGGAASGAAIGSVVPGIGTGIGAVIGGLSGGAGGLFG